MQGGTTTVSEFDRFHPLFLLNSSDKSAWFFPFFSFLFANDINPCCFVEWFANYGFFIGLSVGVFKAGNRVRL